MTYITQKGYNKKRKKLEEDFEEAAHCSHAGTKYEDHSQATGNETSVSSAINLTSKVKHTSTKEALQALFGGQSSHSTVIFNPSQLNEARKLMKPRKKSLPVVKPARFKPVVIKQPIVTKPSTSTMPAPRLICPKPSTDAAIECTCSILFSHLSYCLYLCSE